MQRGGAVDLRRVHIGMLLEQGADAGLIHCFAASARRASDAAATSERRQHHSSEPSSCVDHSESGSSSSLTLPLLSAKESSRTPTLSSSVRCRFASGVGSAYRMCRPPFSLPAAAGHQNRQVHVIVHVGIAHAAAVQVQPNGPAASRRRPAWPSASPGSTRTATRGTR